MTNKRYLYETKLEAVRILNSGKSGRKTCQTLGLKSDGLICTWQKWIWNGEYYRLRQTQGKQYKYQKRMLELPIEVRKEQETQQMKEELEVVKKYLIKEK